MPNFTSTPGPTFTTNQLILAGVLSLILYGTFVFIQTIRHKDDFLSFEKLEAIKKAKLAAQSDIEEERQLAPVPSNLKTFFSFILLLVSLTAVVLLAKVLSPSIESAIASAGAPRSVVGIAIAMLVLLPEGVSAVKAAMNNRLQTSLNLSIGSALASIGLTIPAVAFVSIVFNIPISLGINALGMTFLCLTFFLSVLTIAIGRTTVLAGAVHLVVFAAYLFLSLFP